MIKFKPFKLDSPYYKGEITDCRESLLNVLRILIRFMSGIDALEFLYNARKSDELVDTFGYGKDFDGITLKEWLGND